MHARSPAGENSAPSSVLPLAIPESASPVSESQATQVAAHPGTSLPASAKVTGGDVISRVSPIAPPEAAQLGLRGDVVLQVTIAKDGTIGPIHPLSGDSRLIPSAVDAVRQWRYQPFLEDGKPIEVQGKITIHYGTAQPASQNPSPEPPASVPQ
jgi:TonB family protein